jgi:hypothetical protein
VWGHNPKIFVTNTLESSQCFNVHAPQLTGIPSGGIVTVSERLPSSSILFTVNATDADLGEGGRFNLTVSGVGAVESSVGFNASTGNVFTVGDLTRGSYVISIVRDVMSSRRISYATLVRRTFVCLFVCLFVILIL